MSEGFFGRKLMIAGLAGAAFTGYCIYFDYKRRSAPDYKQTIRENRRAKSRTPAGSEGRRAVPSPMDPAGMQAFFLQEMQEGEELLGKGEVEEGAKRLANAVMLCGQGQEMIAILQQTMPPGHFEAILRELPEARLRMNLLFNPDSGSSSGTSRRTEAGSDTPLIEEIGNEVAHLQELIDDDLE